MHKTERYFNKKKNGQHNFFGEIDCIEIKDGTVTNLENSLDAPPDNSDDSSEEESG